MDTLLQYFTIPQGHESRLGKATDSGGSHDIDNMANYVCLDYIHATCILYIPVIK